MSRLSLSADASPSGPPRKDVPRWRSACLLSAGLLGAAGVAVGAAGAHRGGGDLARTASDFMLIHAVALVAGGGTTAMPRPASALFLASLGLLGAGAVLFGGELACAALLDWRPVPLAAPAGGLCLIAGWLGIAATAAAGRLGDR